MSHWTSLGWAASVVDHPAQHGVAWVCLLGAFAAAILCVRILAGPGLWRFMWVEFVNGWSEGLWFWMTMGGLLQPSTWASSERMWARYVQGLLASEAVTMEDRTAPVRAFLDYCRALRDGKVPALLWRRLAAWPSWPGVLGSYLVIIAPAHQQATREAVEKYLEFVRRSHRIW
jgi:hypothetical protein